MPLKGLFGGGDHEVERSGSTFFGGVTLRLNRPRPPEPPEAP